MRKRGFFEMENLWMIIVIAVILLLIFGLFIFAVFKKQKDIKENIGNKTGNTEDYIDDLKRPVGTGPSVEYALPSVIDFKFVREIVDFFRGIFFKVFN